MNAAMLRAFRDELEKQAGFMRDVGSNVGNTLKGFTTPVQSLKKGWQSGGWSMAGDAVGGMKAGRTLAPWEKNWVKGKGVGKYLPGGKTMTLATGALMAPSAFKKEDPSGQGRTRTERIARLAGNQLGGLIGTPYGISGAMAGSLVGEMGGMVAGKLLNKVRGKKKQTATPAREPELPEPAQARMTGPQVE